MEGPERALRTFIPRHRGPLEQLVAKASKTATEDGKDATEDSRSRRWLEIEDSSGVDGGDGGDDDSTSHYVLQCYEEANAYIRDIAEPLNLVSIMGPTRSGKSTLMNLLAGCKSEELFPTSPGGDSYTKGTDLGNKIMTAEDFSSTDGGGKVEPDVKGQKIAFVDTEGQGDQGDLYDVILFTPSILCSRMVIFNTTDVGKDTILTSLALMTHVASQVDFGKAQSGSSAKFGDLVIIINKDTLGSDEEKVRKNVLDTESGSSTAVIRRNNIRKELFAQFNDISLHILPGNSLKDGVLEKINNKEKKFLVLDDFKDSFVKTFMSLRAAFSTKLKAPRVVAEKSLSGQSTADFVDTVVKSINELEEGGKLHVPDIWDQAENEAINKACMKFRNDLKEKYDELYNNLEISTTRACTKKLDDIRESLLATVKSCLSWLALQKISDTCKLLSEESESKKIDVLELNLLKIKTFAQSELSSLVESLNNKLANVFPTKLVSCPVVTAKVNQLRTDLLHEYETKIFEYDERALPSGYSETYSGGFSVAEATIRDTISTEWKNWAVQRSDTSISFLKTSLDDLTKSTTVGDDSTWRNGADSIKSSNISTYDNTIDTEYLWDSPARAKDSHVKKVDNVGEVAKAQFERNEDDAKKCIDQELDKQLLAYQTKLNDSLRSKEDPGDFATITDATSYRDSFKKYLKQQNISESLTTDYLGKFDNRVSEKKRIFRSEYDKAFEKFLAYLKGELDQIRQLRLGDFELEADSVLISTKLLRSQLNAQLVSYETKILNQFDSDVKRFKITQADCLNHVKMVRRNLESKIIRHKASKLIFLTTVVGDWNRQTLNSYTNVVLARVIDYTLDTAAKLKVAIDTAKKSYWAEACGEEDEKTEPWNTFDQKTANLYKNIQRCQNTFIIKDVESTSCTSDMEKRVIGNLRSEIASLANYLGMAWIGGGTNFANETKTQGKGRSHLQKNMDSPSGYDSDHRTSLRFDNWKAEFSDFVFDDPIVQELKPFVFHTVEGPSQNDDYTVNVGFNQMQSETISNTNTFMFALETEYSSTAGVEGVASTSLKLDFQASASFSNTKENQVTFGVSFDYPIVCPANRKTTINCLAFKQQVSVTYTAKVRLIPEVTFTGGFTRWGGEDNENPNYLKGHSRQRVYDDILNGYTNEFKQKAAADSDPWSWKDCIKKYDYVQNLVNSISADNNYEMYVRGKWEGVNGWKHVIQTNIQVEDAKTG